MNNKIKEAFDSVHAEEALKAKTRERLFQKKASSHRFHYRHLIPVFACIFCMFLCIGGYRFYLTPVSSISVDINPSIELDLNLFDQVVSVKGYNEDGKDLAKALDVRFLNYKAAMKRILENPHIQKLLAQNELMSITVIDDDEAKQSELLAELESCTSHHQNVSCYSGNYEEADHAHELGLSYGKYRIFLELQALDPSITPEDVQGLTMREIRDLIYALSDSSNSSTSAVISNTSPGKQHHNVQNGNHHNAEQPHKQNKNSHGSTSGKGRHHHD